MVDWIRVREELLSGKPILVFDSISREAETDMVYYAGLIDHTKITRLRREAGGLICYVSGSLFRRKLGLSFLNEVFSKHPSYKELATKKPRYGDPPAFNIWVNHIETRTGISDMDKALTIKRLHYVADLVYKGFDVEALDVFYKEFYAPGHVPVLTSRGLANRRGHTELVTALAVILGLTPSMVIAEMLSEGVSLPREDAIRYARRNDLLYIDGFDIIVEAERRGFLND
ncbi:MAG: 3,4-dihydroxy-2-butanone-4-phosphate synthase [Desulfurococcales archaeon]|nr:3,4-dihydroxy-2-butanone-4-phosphate synthase [Desulfurococcales archaeon]